MELGFNCCRLRGLRRAGVAHKTKLFTLWLCAIDKNKTALEEQLISRNRSLAGSGASGVFMPGLLIAWQDKYGPTPEKCGSIFSIGKISILDSKKTPAPLGRGFDLSKPGFEISKTLRLFIVSLSSAS